MVLCNYVRLLGDLSDTVVQYDAQFSPDEPIRRNRIDFVSRLMVDEKKIPITAFVYNGQAIVFMSVPAAGQLQLVSQTFSIKGTWANDFERDLFPSGARYQPVTTNSCAT